MIPLVQIGYEVLVAVSGEEALALYREKADVIDVVILDMIMPGPGGGETLRPSGYSINGQAVTVLNRGCAGFIQKPFNMSELSEKIEKSIRGDIE